MQKGQKQVHNWCGQSQVKTHHLLIGLCIWDNMSMFANNLSGVLWTVPTTIGKLYEFRILRANLSNVLYSHKAWSSPPQVPKGHHQQEIVQQEIVSLWSPIWVWTTIALVLLHHNMETNIQPDTNEVTKSQCLLCTKRGWDKALPQFSPRGL